MKPLRIVLMSALGLGAVGLVTFVTWANNAAPAEPQALAAAKADGAVVIGSRNGFITIRPATSEPDVGFSFYPGARVAPEAYVAKLSRVAELANIQIVIGRPRLNLAVFSASQADEMRAALPGVTHFYVGGHSLGGAVACWYASKHRNDLEGVVLMGTYCGSDHSDSSLRVLSISGDRDGVFPPDEISARRTELPANAQVVRVPGMNHAEFGNYGAQSGDNGAVIDDSLAARAIANAAKAFFIEQTRTARK